jgi:hypothetical protein
MSKMGSIYQVPDESRTAFAQCKARPDWYQVLGEIESRGSLCSADIGDCIDSWREIFEGKTGWLPLFFFGEFSSVNDWDDSGGPDMFFAGRDIVVHAASELSEPIHVMLSKRYNIDFLYRDVLASVEPLKASLLAASGARSAVVGLWG